MFLCETHLRPSFRIDKNGAQRSASGAVFPASSWSIPMLQIKFLPVGAKLGHLSVKLPGGWRRARQLAAFLGRGDKQGEEAGHCLALRPVSISGLGEGGCGDERTGATRRQALPGVLRPAVRGMAG